MTNAELAILSLVAEVPRHGYEIDKVINQRGMRDWTEVGFSSIYYLLNKLEKASMIDSTMDVQGGRGPARKVYSITAAGSAALTEATLEALSNPIPCTTPFLLGIANFQLLDMEQAMGALQEYLVGLTVRRERVSERYQSQQPVPGHVALMFEYSLAMLDAEITWLGRTIENLV